MQRLRGSLLLPPQRAHLPRNHGRMRPSCHSISFVCIGARWCAHLIILILLTCFKQETTKKQSYLSRRIILYTVTVQWCQISTVYHYQLLVQERTLFFICFNMLFFDGPAALDCSDLGNPENNSYCVVPEHDLTGPGSKRSNSTTIY